MNNDENNLNMLFETCQLIADKQKKVLENAAVSYHGSSQLVNDVEFWKWMGANYPKDLGSTKMIQQAANTKSYWLNTQLQGKGYEWDYMVSQRKNPLKLFSKFEAGNCPTQPGIDITETGLFNNSVKATYQNKAYVSSNNPDLHNTPKDAIVVTNREKVSYSQNHGYKTEGYMDSENIREVRDSRFKKAKEGRASTVYTLKNIAASSAKAGAISAVIGMTTETIASYKDWKNGELSSDQYIEEVLKSGGDSGITGAATTAIMIPIQAEIVAVGASALISIPVAIVLSAAVNSVVAPCFGRGKYRKILGKAKYYQAIEKLYDDFFIAVENSAKQYIDYINQIQMQTNKYNHLKQLDKNLSNELKKLYKLI